MSPATVSWEDFAAKVSEITEADVTRVSSDARLVEDLDLDSLGLIELVVALVNDYGLTMPGGLDAQRWEGLTAGQLFEAVRQGSLP